jgi:multidrug resistance efflux pump
VPVKRGSLIETLSLDGVVVPQAQESVTYATRARVDIVKVKAGDNVKEGDGLIDFDSADATHNLDLAQAELKGAQKNLDKAQADTQVSQATAAQKYAADLQAQQQSIADAELGLSRARDNLTRVKAGRSQTDRQVANTAVSYYGSTNLAQAQDALDKLLAGPDPAAIRAAQHDVASAQLAYDKAQADLKALTMGPDAAGVRDAELAVQRAQTQLMAAQAAQVDPKAADPNLAKQQLELAIQDAQLGLNKAQDRLTQLKQPPAAVDVQNARFRVTDAESTLATAQAKLDSVMAGPDQAAIDAAQHGLDAAKHALAELQAGADEVNSHPQPWELAQAEDQVRKAQAALDEARKPIAPSDVITNFSDLVDSIQQAQANVIAAQQAVDATHLRAPFDGTVVSVRVRSGDTIAPAKPLIILARPGQPMIKVDLDDTSAARLSAGQQASVQLSATTTSTGVPATLAGITPAAKDGSAGAFATFTVKWSADDVARFGTPVTIVVDLQRKDNVLVVPASAVHRVGSRSSVEVQDGSLRRVVNVEVGISSPEGVEIVSGLTEGQMVLAGPA